jgi:hypothetical protein
MTMYVTELDTFVQKFKNLWQSGLNAHLDVNTHAGKAWVSLHVQLEQAPGPLYHPLFSNKPGRSRDTPSRQRRRARRAAARKEQTERTNHEETEAVEFETNDAGEANIDDNDANAVEGEVKVNNEEATEEISIAENVNSFTADFNEVTDEICPDQMYNGGKPIDEVEVLANTEVELVNQNAQRRKYPKDCEDCGKYLRNHDDLRNHIEACMIAKYCK